ncbi:hypothetical protein N6L24_13230 [Cognatishimia sp. SS12]|uniref:hypothetical protein n=1 Tax=Cognatishimia sp. SS12 TaxID=2979465 RepID=UPI002330D242|nr:hypothetical protein [Cognatishimia sp. SS12]MDC0739244.1 hypothetical protein [Cognatishimia sp. SS12]
MTDFLPKEVQAGLDAARKADLRKTSRLRVEAGEQSFRILRFRDDGFTLDVDAAPHLRGLVDVYDGARHLYQCLVIASVEEDGEMFYEFKRATAASDKPALDYYREENAPVALVTDQSKKH